MFVHEYGYMMVTQYLVK